MCMCSTVKGDHPRQRCKGINLTDRKYEVEQTHLFTTNHINILYSLIKNDTESEYFQILVYIKIAFKFVLFCTIKTNIISQISLNLIILFAICTLEDNVT